MVKSIAEGVIFPARLYLIVQDAATLPDGDDTLDKREK